VAYTLIQHMPNLKSVGVQPAAHGNSKSATVTNWRRPPTMAKLHNNSGTTYHVLYVTPDTMSGLHWPYAAVQVRSFEALHSALASPCWYAATSDRSTS
jgi:hypothetical protein